MGHFENEKRAADAERQRVRMHPNVDPKDLYTIPGNMAYNAKQAALPKPAPSSWVPTPSYPTYPTVSSPMVGGNVYDPKPSPRVRARRPVRASRPHTPDWSDRAMQRIPKWILVLCSIVGALFGLGWGVQAGAGVLSVGTALLGALAGMLALPLLLKLSYLALKVLVFASVIGGALFIIWQLGQHAK